MKSVSFVTDVRDGDARAPGQLARLLRKKKLPDSFTAAEQIHGNHVHVVRARSHARVIPHADGLLSDVANQPLAIFTADCLPVFLEADNGRIVGILHAGWRGLFSRILDRATTVIRKTWRLPSSSIRVWAGPSIKACCFEVQWDVARYFPRTRRRLGKRWTIDLERELRAQARRRGVRWVNKKGFTECTMHGVRYHSYRRNQTKKRQVSVIMKREIA